MAIELSDQEMLRYNRQIILQNFDFDGQEKLKAAKVLLVGVGGLGCAAAQYLAAAGVGQLTLLDFDTVSLSNLQRQILYNEQSIGSAKVDSAKTTLVNINPYIKISTVNKKLAEHELNNLIKRQDVIVDCTDNVTIREQLNRLCLTLKRPLVSGAAIRMEGQLVVLTYQDNTTCYHCLSRLFGENNLSCIETGVMSPLVGIIGSLQAMETLKLLTNYGQIISGKVLFYDAMSTEFHTINLMPDPNCEICQRNQL